MMNKIWHYIKDNDIPTAECVCLCKIRPGIDSRYITIRYFTNGDWCSVETGDLINQNWIECWANIDDILIVCK